MPYGFAAAAAASIGGALISSSGAQSAASTQANAAQQAAQVQQNMFNTTQANLQPWMAGGTNALAALQAQLGLTGATSPAGATAAPGVAPAAGGGTPFNQATIQAAISAGGGPLGNGYAINQVQTPGADGSTGTSWVLSGPGGNIPMSSLPTAASLMQTLQSLPGQPVAPATASAVPGATGAGQSGSPLNAAGIPNAILSGFQQSPGYQYQLNQGMQQVQNSAAARGGLTSGNTLAALQANGTGLANQDWYNYLSTSLNQYNNYIGQLQNLSGGGQNAAANLGTIGATTANNIGTSLTNAGAATAAGTVGSTNAITSGLTGGVNNYNAYSLLNNLYNGGSGNSLTAANNASIALGPTNNSNLFASSYGYGGS